MVKALVVYCHPLADSFSAAMRDRVMDHLALRGAEARLADLYAMGFDPVLSADGLRNYGDMAANRRGVEAMAEDLAWCDTLIFVYPTWWHGLPAALKGWMDRVLVPGVAFDGPARAGGAIRGRLTQITRLAVFTSFGGGRWATLLLGAPGHRALTRGLRLLCAPRCRTAFAANYSMDLSTPDSRATHLARIGAKLDRLLG
jgi:NAD(P)H dehydrogenase (quinone)